METGDSDVQDEQHLLAEESANEHQEDVEHNAGMENQQTQAQLPLSHSEEGEECVETPPC